MDLRNQLAVAHSRANADTILQWLYADRARTQVLVEVVRSQEEADAKLVQRAAMVLGDLGRRHPEWLLPYQEQLVILADSPPHPAIPRPVLRYFSELPLTHISEPLRGLLLEIAFRHLGDRAAPVTHRVYSMTIIATFAKVYPELVEELQELIEREIAEGAATPGFSSRGRKILAGL